MSAAADRALALLEQLVAALSDERAAVQRLDHAALSAITERKRVLVESIQQLGPVPSGSAPEPLRSRLQTTAASVRAHAEANAALLADAAASVNELLGLRSDSGMYDRRARRLNTVRVLGGSHI